MRLLNFVLLTVSLFGLYCATINEPYLVSPSTETDEYSSNESEIVQRLNERYEKWAKESGSVIKAWQDGESFSSAYLRALCEQGVQIETEARVIATRLRKTTDSRFLSDARKCEQIAEDVKSLNLTLYAILEVSR